MNLRTIIIIISTDRRTSSAGAVESDYHLYSHLQVRVRNRRRGSPILIRI